MDAELPRALTPTERELIAWMIQHGGSGREAFFLAQLDDVEVHG